MAAEREPPVCARCGKPERLPSDPLFAVADGNVCSDCLTTQEAELEGQAAAHDDVCTRCGALLRPAWLNASFVPSWPAWARADDRWSEVAAAFEMVLQDNPNLADLYRLFPEEIDLSDVARVEDFQRVLDGEMESEELRLDLPAERVCVGCLTPEERRRSEPEGIAGLDDDGDES